MIRNHGYVKEQHPQNESVVIDEGTGYQMNAGPLFETVNENEEFIPDDESVQRLNYKELAITI